MMAGNENAALYFIDRHAEGALKDKIAFVESDAGGETITYKDLKDQTNRMVGLLRRYGLRQEDRLALLALDEIAWPVAFWGALKAGVVPVALNTLLSAEVYGVILKDCRPRAMVVSAVLYPTVAPILKDIPSLQTVFVIGGQTPENTSNFLEELSQSSAEPAINVSGDECAFWLYSSGSTGQPKGVRHVHSSLKATADTYGRQVLGIEETDVVYSVAKLFFAYGLGNAMTFPMSVGATTVLFSGRPTPASASEILTNHRPSIFCGVPTLYAAMVAYLQGLEKLPAAPLRRCISAGEALPEDVGKRWAGMWNCDILDGVGSTEMLHIFLSNSPADVVYGTSGNAVPGYDLRLVDEIGLEVTGDAIGELLVRGASAADGYWNQRDRSRLTFEGEWTHTGDKYYRDKSGRYVYCGRTDDMFKVSGIWLSPFEVEQALISHDAVLEAAVVAHRDEDGLEKPLAHVVLKSGLGDAATADILKDHVKQKIGLWKYPRWIKFVDELPKTATGKIQRFKLRD
jgi:4-hydroxybenzoate-CoA ligase